jgi:hypothetical protein
MFHAKLEWVSEPEWPAQVPIHPHPLKFSFIFARQFHRSKFPYINQAFLLSIFDTKAPIDDNHNDYPTICTTTTTTSTATTMASDLTFSSVLAQLGIAPSSYIPTSSAGIRSASYFRQDQQGHCCRQERSFHGHLQGQGQQGHFN